MIVPLHDDDVRWPLNATAGRAGGPLRLDVVRALLSDSETGGLFPDASWEGSAKDLEGLLGAARLVRWSTGDGGALQAVGVVSSLIEAVLVRFVITGSPTLDGAVKIVVSRARRLAAGETASVDRVVRLHGFDLASDEPLVLSDIALRNEAPLRALAPTIGPGGAVIALVPHELSLIDQSPMLRGEAAERWLDQFWAHDAHPYPEEDARARRALDFELRLAILLATRSCETPTSAVADVGIVLNPLGGGGHSWGDTPESSKPATQLVHSDLAGLEFELRRLRSLSTSLRLGSGRLLRAAVERDDPTDALIDSAIAWESFLGTSSETTYRLATATARLLEPDHSGRREELFRKVKKLYGIRSKIVHGVAQPDGVNVDEDARAVLSIGLRVLSAILDRSDLLAATSSERRADMLNLGLGPEHAKVTGASQERKE